MTRIKQTIEGLGRRVAGTLTANTPTRPFANVPLVASARQAVNLNNTSAVDIWVRFTKPGSEAPTITAANNDMIVPAGQQRSLQIGLGVETWIAASAAATYTMLELA